MDLRRIWTPTVLALTLLTLGLAPPAAAQNAIYYENNRVGINEPDPQELLHVSADDGTAQIVVEEKSSTTLTRALLSIVNNGGAGITLENTNSGQDWRLDTSSGRFNITLLGTGNLLQLASDGDLIIDGTLTTASNTYPDYVFEDSYELMPLSELAAYIEENGHLPNVPSAEETDQGRRVNMTELQIQLLEKVEELTLYTLQQQEEIERLREQVAKLADVER